MKKVLAAFSLFWLGISIVHAQYANVELSSGGFSFVPAFTDTNPNLILNAGTTGKGILSAHMIGNIRMESLNPRGFILLLEQKLSINSLNFLLEFISLPYRSMRAFM